MHESVAPRFWAKVDNSAGPNACWTWTGCSQGKGYGQPYMDGRMQQAHRISLMLSGVDVPDDRFVLHKCDNRICVNPSHLRVGTQADNMEDMRIKGRAARGSVTARLGEHHGMSKLAEPDIIAIRASTERSDVLADKYGVSYFHIRKIKRGRHWTHIPADPAAIAALLAPDGADGAGEVTDA